MKKVLFVLAVAGFFAACGGKTETPTESATESSVIEETTSIDTQSPTVSDTESPVPAM